MSRNTRGSLLGLDPTELARRQIAIDRVRTRRYPSLFEKKAAKMRTSALAFLRGAAPLFYEILEGVHGLSGGPPGDGWLVGDAHVENFGAFVADARGRAKPGPVFDVNDFDDCFVGPLRFDVLRLATSFILAGRTAGLTGARVVHATADLVSSWNEHTRGERRMPPVPQTIRALVEKVRGRSRHDLLDARTPKVGGRRRFVRGDRYANLSSSIARALPAAFTRYLGGLPDALRPSDDEGHIVDAAFRIAGTGSLGVLRIAVLARGKGEPDGAWLFDLKEEGAPAGARLGHVPGGHPAARVMAGMQACLEQTPRWLGTTSLLGLSLLGRRLAPQEDRLDVSKLAPDDLPPLAASLGAYLGRVHRRGLAARGGRRPGRWSALECKALVEQAIWMAGIHEGVYLAFCALTYADSVWRGPASPR